MTKLTKAEKLTLNTYKEIAQEWIDEHADERISQKDLDTFFKYLPAGKILEIGAGGGRDAKRLLEKGYDYTGTDISDELLNVARKRLPQGKFITQSVYELDFPENTFDGFWCFAVLLHVPKFRINEALSKIYEVIKSGGVGFISVKQGEGEKIVEEETPSGQKYKRFFAYYLPREFNKILEDNNFEVLKSEIRPVTQKTTWLVYIVKVIKNG